MADVLNQDDVDALLSAIGSGGIEAEAGGGAADGVEAIAETPGGPQVFSMHEGASNFDIHPYDFRHPERVSKDQMRSLEQLYEGFARNFGAALSGFLRTITELRVTSIEQVAYSEYIHGLPNPTSFNLISCRPLNGLMCLEISPMIIYPIIDRLLGGSNDDLFIPERPLSQIEQRLVTKITDRALEAIDEAWGNILPMKSVLEQIESNPQLAQIVPPNEVVIVIGFEMKMDGRTGTMSKSIPFNVIEPVVDKLSSQGWYDSGQRRPDVRQAVADKLARAPLETSAILAETTMTMSDLVGMALGDLIVTEKASEKPVVLSVEGRKKFLANLGQYKGKRALKITRAITPEDRV
jgi:flagellar motor switch protein FliM